MAETTGGQNNKTRNIILLSLLGLMLIVAGVSIYYNVKQDSENEFVQQELDNTFKKLTSVRDELDQKILEELKKVRGEMESEMLQLRESSDIAWARYNKIKNKVEGYEELLLLKDKEIAKLQNINDALLTENTDLKNEKNNLEDSIGLLARNTSKLAEKVKVASRLEAENIVVSALNKKGKERDGEFRARQIEQLKVEFKIAKNDVAPVEGKDILIRILEPEGNVMFDVAKGSGTFLLNGKEQFYTSKQEILFDNTNQLLTFFYEKGSEFNPGQHTVEIYTDGYIMGSQDFVVK